MPDLDRVGDRERADCRGGQQGDEVVDEEQVAPVNAVGEHAHRDRTGGEREPEQALDEAQQQRGVGELDDEPALGRELHHQPQRDEEVAQPEQPERWIR